MTLDASDLLRCSGSFDETRVADELVFQMDFGTGSAGMVRLGLSQNPANLIGSALPLWSEG